MESKLIESINKQVYKKFPEVHGVNPAITPRPAEQVLLVYKAAAVTADGRPLDRTVRVVADAAGKIIKMSTSK
jgi:hypothetical protein